MPKAVSKENIHGSPEEDTTHMTKSLFSCESIDNPVISTAKTAKLRQHIHEIRPNDGQFGYELVF